jgi:hypothetical protein
LDARDAFNRPIKSTIVRESFEQLWIKSLNRLLVNALTPVQVRLMSLLNSAWDGFAGKIASKLADGWRFSRAWIQQKKRDMETRFVRSRSFSPLLISEPGFSEAGNSFLFLIHFVISSTRILR